VSDRRVAPMRLFTTIGSSIMLGERRCGDGFFIRCSTRWSEDDRVRLRGVRQTGLDWTLRHLFAVSP